MKTKTQGRKILLFSAGAFIILAVLSYCVLRFGFSIDILDRSGWHEKDGSVQYWDYYGKPQVAWQTVEQKRYYFDPETGNLMTGWQTIGEKQYYFGQDGGAVIGWHRQDGQLYYFSEDGSAVKGWQTINGQRYCFSSSGNALSGWEKLDGKQYFFEDGKPAIGWKVFDGKKYWFCEEGYTLSGWVEIEGNRFLFADDGALYTGWFSDEDGTRFFDQDGVQQTGWLEREEKRYYFQNTGLMHTGWLEWENDRYYLNDDGTMAVGEVEIDGISHFFTSKGKWTLMVNPWHALPEDFVLDLVELEGYQVDRQCRDALEAMLKACRNEGFYCDINNAYRSVGLQQYMWNLRIEAQMAKGKTYEQAVAYIGQELAKVNHSEHHTGLAVDFSGSDAMYDWLAENCWDYGFILRYPEGKTPITGIAFEPWHFRYVGTELSLELKELGLCMEEYFDMLTK